MTLTPQQRGNCEQSLLSELQTDATPTAGFSEERCLPRDDERRDLPGGMIFINRYGLLRKNAAMEYS